MKINAHYYPLLFQVRDKFFKSLGLEDVSRKYMGSNRWTFLDKADRKFLVVLFG
jgi:hypothetical protein